ncbi:MAG TPA: shikimate dehydrogenase [Candidatus Yonathbacteria bacterium]|nr:shikimate dehydrogenase [Candidatus Yonathbacteria bacterium]
MKNIKITKNTKFCISIASAPGNFGSLIFNRTFKALSLDFIYKPFRATPDNLNKAILGVRALDIRGCGVSMPHKTIVHKYVDAVDPVAKEIGAINTIVNTNGILTGYNTDVVGVEMALEKYYPIKGKTAHIIGAGGASRAIIVALKRGLCKEITLSNRDEKKARMISKKFSIKYCPSNVRKEIKADILINATPVGMTPKDQDMIVDKDELKNYHAIMDVVVSPMHTKLIKTAKKAGKITISGYEMATYQAAAQFTLYTGIKAPLRMMTKYVKDILKEL